MKRVLQRLVDFVGKRAVAPGEAIPRAFGVAFGRSNEFEIRELVIARLPFNLLIRAGRSLYLWARYPKISRLDRRDPGWVYGELKQKESLVEENRKIARELRETRKALDQTFYSLWRTTYQRDQAIRDRNRLRDQVENRCEEMLHALEREIDIR